MNNHRKRVRQFFDNISDTYQERFTEKRPFLSYFFNTRIERAIAGLDVDHKMVWDIGAGTGRLYDYLKKNHEGVNYWACDISSAMMQQGNIPAERQLQGAFDEVKWPAEKADFIFALGLTTYMKEQELMHFLSFINSHLTKSGRAVVSFSNAESCEVYWRKKLSNISRLYSNNNSNKFSFQPFKVKNYSFDEIINYTQIKKLYLVDRTYLIPGIPFLNHISPKLSVLISRTLSRSTVFPFIRRRLSVEFLISVSKNGQAENIPKTKLSKTSDK